MTKGINYREEFVKLLTLFLIDQKEWSERTFGPIRSDPKHDEILAHILLEVEEVRANKSDPKEWIDIVLLGFEGALRTVSKPRQVADALNQKQLINFDREWLVKVGAPCEHKR